MPELDLDAIAQTQQSAIERLLASRLSHGHWEGRLSSSALSTATATCALAAMGQGEDIPLVRAGTKWLAEHQNPDGGWGDTTRSRSNLGTTALCWAAFAAANADAEYQQVVERAGRWLARAAGSLGPEALSKAISARYGADRTFSAPILTMCAVSGRLGGGRAPWRLVTQLPFELGTLPHRWLRWLRVPVVSYALPALIAIGQVRHHHAPGRNPLTRLLRSALRGATLRRLEAIQPPSGGFLEAAPLTSFVAMSLAAMGRSDYAVTRRCRDFLRRSAREDGSWPIDENLATWLTTLSVNALAPDQLARLESDDREAIREWLLGQQHRQVHPYTGAAPGGWAWTDLPGGVPDADDTAGALLALAHLAPDEPRVREAALQGIEWLLGLQNRDGGIPTFCRGWGKLPFDRSAPDLTGHALAAFSAWRGRLPASVARRVQASMAKMVHFLRCNQREDGAWVPLWFGNENAPDEANPVYGAARVISAMTELAERERRLCAEACERAVSFLLDAQSNDGGWGGDRGMEPSIEETALATEGLARVAAEPAACRLREKAGEAAARGAMWLVERTDKRRQLPAGPIGLYFARLWYYEDLYPLIFLIAALKRATRALREP